MRRMAKRVLYLISLLALSVGTAYADIIDPGPIPPEPIASDSPMTTVAIVATVVLAAAIIAWIILRSRKNK